MISFKNFERNSKRFKKITHQKIDDITADIYDKYIISDVLKSDIDIMISNIVRNYKRSPFKRKSSYNIENDFLDTENKIKSIRIQYLLTEDSLVFKMLTRVKNKYKRNCQLVIKLK